MKLDKFLGIATGRKKIVAFLWEVFPSWSRKLLIGCFVGRMQHVKLNRNDVEKDWVCYEEWHFCQFWDYQICNRFKKIIFFLKLYGLQQYESFRLCWWRKKTNAQYRRIVFSDRKICWIRKLAIAILREDIIPVFLKEIIFMMKKKVLIFAFICLPSILGL